MRHTHTAGICLSLLILGGCQPMSSKEQGQVVGGVLGGILGKSIGDSTASTIAGTVLGQYLGGQLADHWKTNDQLNVINTLNRRQDSKVMTYWHTAETRYDMTAQPMSLHQGVVCRDFKVVEKQSYNSSVFKVQQGTACLVQNATTGHYEWSLN